MNLLVKPFFGELGHHIFNRQGYIRYISSNFDKITIIGRPDEWVFYDDFCQDYIGFDPESEETSGFEIKGGKRPPVGFVDESQYDVVIDSSYTCSYNYDHITGEINLPAHSTFYQQKFVQYGYPNTDWGFDILVHARSTDKWGTGKERNYPIDKWNRLVKCFDGLKIGSIGTVKSADYVKGTYDLRGIQLYMLCDIMASSKLTVGPSSGPMHLSSICGCPHVVWSHEFNRLRYEKYWNPLLTKVKFFGDKGWQPDVEDILPLIKEFLNDD